MPPPVGTQPTITLQPVSLNLANGTTVFSATTLGALYSTVSFTLTRNAAWADSAGIEILEFLVDVSFDARVNWRPWCGFGVSGGVIPGLTTHHFVHLVPAPCDVRGHLVNKTGALLTATAVTVACN